MRTGARRDPQEAAARIGGTSAANPVNMKVISSL
jgi:hypothetical protein